MASQAWMLFAHRTASLAKPLDPCSMVVLSVKARVNGVSHSMRS